MPMEEPDSSIPYVKIQKFLMNCCGIWPYNSRLVNCLIYSFFVVFSFTTMTPLSLGLNEEANNDIVTYFETLVAVVAIFGGFAQITMLGIRNHLLKCLYRKISTDWRTLKDARETEILSAFSIEGRSLTFLFMLITISSYVFYLLLTYIPLINDEVASSDYSEIFPYYSNDWIISDRMRHLQVILHGCFGIFYGGAAYIIVMALYICSFKHICGMYAIVGYRLKRLVTSCKLTSSGELRDDDAVSKLYAIIDQHEEAIKGVRLLVRLFSRFFFIIELFLLICLAFLIFVLQYDIRSSKVIVRIFLASIILVTHVFFMNYGGEQIIHYSSKIHTTTHFMQWYLLSVKCRRILLMVIQRSCQSEQLSAGIMTLSLENFTSIIRASWSMGTVLMSAHRKE
ncbi:odorant receptor 190 [Nasonia vitripennis]|uniref:Odorant receptor n=1 Tax=Nasonia vitripennis TaxID=7425 RepID=A0A7M6UGG7_NASVI|nr:odorant receptor 190 [Nasonia vitripennis]